MRRIALTAVFALTVLAMPVFGKDPPKFVEEPIPDGKAIIYIYSRLPVPTFAPEGWGVLLVLGKNGPLAVLLGASYFPLVTDPGTVELWFLMGSGGQYGSGMLARKFVTEAIVGQASFIVLIRDGDIQAVPASEAKTDKGILYCKKVE